MARAGPCWAGILLPVLIVAHPLAGGPLPSEIDGSAVGCASDLRLTGNGESDPTGLAPALGNDWPLDGVSMERRPVFPAVIWPSVVK